MSAAEHEPLEPEPKEFIVRHLEGQGRLTPQELRIRAYDRGIKREEYEEAVDGLRLDGKVVFGIDQTKDGPEPYVRVTEEY